MSAHRVARTSTPRHPPQMRSHRFQVYVLDLGRGIRLIWTPIIVTNIGMVGPTTKTAIKLCYSSQTMERQVQGFVYSSHRALQCGKLACRYLPFECLSSTPIVGNFASFCMACFALTENSGHCTVAVLLPEGPGMSDNMIVDTSNFNGAAEELRDKCVQSQGIGGKFTQQDEMRSRTVVQIPEIMIFAPDSKWKDFLDLKYKCPADAQGDAKCKSAAQSKPRIKSSAYGVQKYRGAFGKQGRTRMPKSGSKQRCSGSCLNPKDCDINSDCVCASNKGTYLLVNKLPANNYMRKLTSSKSRHTTKQLMGPALMHICRWCCSRNDSRCHLSANMSRSMHSPGEWDKQ